MINGTLMTLNNREHDYVQILGFDDHKCISDVAVHGDERKTLELALPPNPVPGRHITIHNISNGKVRIFSDVIRDGEIMRFARIPKDDFIKSSPGVGGRKIPDHIDLEFNGDTLLCTAIEGRYWIATPLRVRKYNTIVEKL